MKGKFVIHSIAIGIGAIVLSSAVSMGNTNVFASTGGKTADNAITWVRSKLGKGIDYDKAYGNQCVDLTKAYYAYLGQAAQRGNGADYTYNALPSGWTRIKGAQPKKGDVLVYTGGYGGYGHVAIYESDYSSYHQNWNGHSYVERVTSYFKNAGSVKYWGVVRPDFSTVSGTVKSTKNVLVTGVSINKSSISLSRGKSYALSAAVKPSNATNKNVKWSSSNPSVVTVSSKGVVTAVKGGSAIITVRTEDGSKTASCTVSVPFTGIKKVNGNWTYVVNDKPDYGFTGAALSTDGVIRYVRKGKFLSSYTGVGTAKSGNVYYFEKGVKSKKTCVVKNTNGKWIYVKSGKYYRNFTGAAISTDKTIRYVKNGNHITTFNGIARAASGNRYYMKNGVVNKSFTGYVGKLYVKNGKVV